MVTSSLKYLSRLSKTLGRLFARQPQVHYDPNALRIRGFLNAPTKTSSNRSNRHIVIFNIRGWSLHNATDALLTAELRRSGNKVTLLNCADSVPFCMYGPITKPAEWQRNCDACCKTKNEVFSGYAPQVHLAAVDSKHAKFSQALNLLGSIEEALDFVHDQIPYGRLVYPGLAWFLRRSSLRKEDLAFYKSALSSAKIAVDSVNAVLDNDTVDCFVMLNGDFVLEKAAGFVLKQRGVRFISHDYTFEGRLGVALNSSLWDDLTYAGKQHDCLGNVSEYHLQGARELVQKWTQKGGYQGELFWDPAALKSKNTLREELGLDSRPVVTAYTNLTYESSVIGKERAFSSQEQWISQLVRWFGDHPELQLVIRSHPAEERQDHWRPNETLTEYIDENLMPLPSNVHFIRATSNVSSYALGEMSCVSLVYSSTIGLEFAVDGKTVMTAAHVHYSERGFTFDPKTTEEYFETLGRLVRSGCAPEIFRKRAEAYIAWFLFERQVAIEPLKDEGGPWPSVTCNSLSNLNEGSTPGVHKVCRLIETGTPWW